MRSRKTGWLLILLFLLGAGGVFSQTSAPTSGAEPVLKFNPVGGDQSEIYKIGEITGNINRKAVNLAKPVYPAQAREAGVDGTVKVQITLDEEGTVTEATAVSGHPLLKNAAEEAARKTKFRKVSINGEAPKMTGVLIYYFEIAKAGWIKIGYHLSIVQKAPTLLPFIVPAVAKAFEPGWTSEREWLEKLNEMRRAELEMRARPETINKPVLQKSLEKAPGGMTQSRVTAQIALPTPFPPTPERVAAAQNLIAGLQTRLAGDEPGLWQFNLGVYLGSAMYSSRNPTDRANLSVTLRQFAASAAQLNIEAETQAELQKLILIFEKETRTLETQNELARLLASLLRRQS